MRLLAEFSGLTVLRNLGAMGRVLLTDVCFFTWMDWACCEKMLLQPSKTPQLEQPCGWRWCGGCRWTLLDRRAGRKAIRLCGEGEPLPWETLRAWTGWLHGEEPAPWGAAWLLAWSYGTKPRQHVCVWTHHTGPLVGMGQVDSRRRNLQGFQILCKGFHFDFPITFGGVHCKVVW